MISMPSGFINVATAERVSIIFFPKLGNVICLKAEHCKTLLKHAAKKDQVINPLEDG